MENDSFVDFYEFLEIDFDAPDEVIEQRFRKFAKEPHPETADAEQIETFSRRMEAFETLTDADLRSAYDEAYETEKQIQLELLNDANCGESDAAQRHRLLSLFYAKRRQSAESPGIGNTTLHELAKIPANVLKFHVWYMTEKNWIQRGESGQLAISAEGVDKVESWKVAAAAQPVSTESESFDNESLDNKSLDNKSNPAPVDEPELADSSD